MTRQPLDPNQIPDDASGKDLAGYVGEDIGRSLMTRLAAFVAAICAVAGVTADADEGVKAAALVAGLLGALTILVAALGGVRRSRQWTILLVVLVVCGGLLATAIAQHRA